MVRAYAEGQGEGGVGISTEYGVNVEGIRSDVQPEGRGDNESTLQVVDYPCDSATCGASVDWVPSSDFTD